MGLKILPSNSMGLKTPYIIKSGTSLNFFNDKLILAHFEAILAHCASGQLSETRREDAERRNEIFKMFKICFRLVHDNICRKHCRNDTETMPKPVVTMRIIGIVARLVYDIVRIVSD